MSSRLTSAPRAVKIGYTCVTFGTGASHSTRTQRPAPTAPQAADSAARRDSDDGSQPSSPLPNQPPDQGEDVYDDEVDGTENGNLV
jgi:hypothetical protein